MKKEEADPLDALNRSIDRFCYRHPRFGIRNLMKYIVITDQLILTAPVSVGKIVVGKFFALETIYAVPVFFTLENFTRGSLETDYFCFHSNRDKSVFVCNNAVFLLLHRQQA